jgi:LmbE family N-acetylglucosaminyl deacetylase
MQWIYLSPHFDDAALSCGGLIWEQCQAGEQVSVWTLCAAAPQTDRLSSFAESLHLRWQTGKEAVMRRQFEDAASNQVMGASFHNFGLADCIYRQDAGGNFLYASEESLFGPLHEAEKPLVEMLARQMGEAAPGGDIHLVCPLTLGGHVDHQLARAAAEAWQRQAPGLRLWYYPDFPYALKDDQALNELKEKGWQEKVFPISQAGLQAWADAVAAHASQISTFWPGVEEMREALRAYNQQFQGIRLYFMIQS